MIAHDYKTQHLNRDMLLAALTAVLGRLPSLGAWWHGADWELLGRAAGVLPREAVAAHWLSRDLAWRLLWPLAGLEPDPWTWLRLLLHAAVAAGVVRLAARLGYAPWARLLAGLLVAVSPLAFRPLLTAEGFTTVMPAALGVWALVWGSSGRTSVAALGVIAGAGAILAGPTGWALAPLAIWYAVTRLRNGDDGRPAVIGATAWTALTVLAIVLVIRQLPPPDAPSLAVACTALARAPLWMLTPLPVHGASIHPAVALGGLSVWVLWGIVARRRARDGDRRALALLAAALLLLAPSLPWRSAGGPGACLAAWIPAALMLAPLLAAGTVRGPRPVVLTLLVVAFGAAAWGGTLIGLKQRRGDGRPADPVVRATAVSYEASRRLRDLPDVIKQVVVMQPGPTGRTPLFEALGDGAATRLILPDGPPVRWSDDLDDLVPRDHVLADAGTRLRIWGPPVQARLLLVLTRIGQGRQAEAADLLYRTLAGTRRTIPLFYSEDQLTVAPSRVRDHVPAFLEAVDAYEPPDGGAADLRPVAEEFLRRSGLLADRRP